MCVLFLPFQMVVIRARGGSSSGDNISFSCIRNVWKGSHLGKASCLCLLL